MSKTVSRKGKFLKDLGLYSIGSIGSKLITFLLVPLYTFAISPSDFGYYDICLTVIFFFGPVISFQLGDGAFRFLLETKDFDRKRQIISFVALSVMRNIAVIVALVLVAGFFIEVRYLHLIMVYGIVQSLFDVSLQLTRGLGDTKTYVLTGITNSISVALLTVVFIVVLKWGLLGLFLANILARSLSIVFVELRSGIISKYFTFRLIDKELQRQLLRYSLPMLPAVLIWMVLNGSHVFFIKHFLGLAENGIYAVLAKFTSILYVLSIIFYQTWQQNAIEQYNSPDRDTFFSKVFNNYVYILGLLMVVFPMLLKINYGWIVGPEYQSSRQYLFFDALYMVVFALATFYEIGYQCAKQTYRILPSFILITVIGFTLYYYLTPLWRINGVIFSSLITYGVLLVYRVIDTRRYMRIRFFKRNYWLILLVALAGVLFHLDIGIGADIIGLCVLAALYLFMLPRDIAATVLSRLHR